MNHMVINNTLNVVDDNNLNDFTNKVQKGNWLVWYYANWCGHCVNMKDEWNKYSDKCLKNKKINLASVRSDFIEKLEYDKQHDVQGYPTIILYINGKKKSNFDLPERNSTNFDKFVNLNINKKKCGKSLKRKRHNQFKKRKVKSKKNNN